jgi:hypothetical protein
MTTARNTHAIAGETNDNYRWIVLGVTSVGALLAALTSGTLVIALPEILRDLHTDLFTLLWIVVGYTLAATVLVLNAGRSRPGGPGKTYVDLPVHGSLGRSVAPPHLLVAARLSRRRWRVPDGQLASSPTRSRAVSSARARHQRDGGRAGLIIGPIAVAG